MISRKFVSFVSLALVAMLSACGGGEDGGGTVVVNEQRTLSEGQLVSYALTAGTYTLDATASNNGVKVEWVGGTGCTNSAETKTYSAVCKLNSTGQVIVTNPTLLGLGGSEIVTIKITAN